MLAMARSVLQAMLWLAALHCLPAIAQTPTPSVVGIWRVVSVETRELASGKIARPFVDRPTGTFVFSPGGRMLGMQYATDRKAPATANATEAERAALLSSMSAYSGTYRVEGAKLIITIEDSSIQSWNGTKRVINFETDGKRLTGTSEPFKGLITGQDVVAVITWERLE